MYRKPTDYDKYLQRLEMWKTKKSLTTPTSTTKNPAMSKENYSAQSKLDKKRVLKTAGAIARPSTSNSLKTKSHTDHEMRDKLAEWRKERERKKQDAKNQHKNVNKPQDAVSQNKKVIPLLASSVSKPHVKPSYPVSKRPSSGSAPVSRSTPQMKKTSNSVKPYAGKMRTNPKQPAVKPVSKPARKSTGTLVPGITKPSILKRRKTADCKDLLSARGAVNQVKQNPSLSASTDVLNKCADRRLSYTVDNESSFLVANMTDHDLDISHDVTGIQESRRLSYTITEGSSMLATSCCENDNSIAFESNSGESHNTLQCVSKTPCEDKRHMSVGKIPSKATAVVTPVRRSVRFQSPEIIEKSVIRKTKPQTPNKTPVRFSTPQKEMSQRDKLNKWLKSRGKTPSSFRHLHCFCKQQSEKKEMKRRSSSTVPRKAPSQGSTPSKVPSQGCTPSKANLAGSHEDKPEVPLQLDMQIDSQLDDMLNECYTLFEAGCPLDAVLPWLDNIVANIPTAIQSACYYSIRAKVIEDEVGDDVVLELFEQAVRHKAKPPELVADALKEFVERMTARQKAKVDASHTPARQHQRRKSGVEPENMFQSSAVKYMYCETTPFFRRIRSAADISASPCAVVTPVRRSTRRSIASLPRMFQDHDVVMDSMDDLDVVKRGNVLFNENMALEDIE